jgi:hypothetical protein
MIDPLLTKVIDQTPRRAGYSAEAWSITLLGQYLRDVHHLAVNRASISAALGRLGRRERIVRSSGAEFEMEGVTG